MSMPAAASRRWVRWTRSFPCGASMIRTESSSMRSPAARRAEPAAPGLDMDLRGYLDAVRARYGPAHLGSDPICFPRRYAAPEDREIAGFLASALAYGRVPQIQASVAR